MTIQFTLNGKKVHVNYSVPPSLSLAEYLRNYAGLTGTKIACGEGGCGACTVHVSYKQGDEIVSKSINSCLTPLHAIDGTSITTVEGIGGEKSGKFHPVQERISEKHATQCGYCSPGMSMAIFSYLRDNKNRSAEEAEQSLDGNLCRCTGYRPILDTVQSFCSPNVDIEELGSASCPLQQKKSFHTSHGDSHWYRVTSIAELVELQKSVKNLKIIAGGTSRGIYKDEFEAKSLVDISAVQELHKVEHSDKGVRIGAGTSINKFISTLKEISQIHPSQKGYFGDIIKHAYLIAGTSVRNNATIGGSIALKAHRPDFPSDLVTIFAAAGAKLQIHTGEISVEIPIGESVKLDHNSLIVSVYIPFARANEHFLSYKIAIRHQNAHAYVNHSFRFLLNESKDEILDSSAVFGALSPKVQHAHKVVEFLKGKKLGPELIDGALSILSQEISVEGVLQPEYCKNLAVNLLYKSLLRVLRAANILFDPKLQSAAQPYERPVSTGEKTYGELDDDEKPIGSPVPKLEAKIQASGEATYADDVASKNRNTLYGAYVLSTVAVGKIKSIDISAAEAEEGFVSWVTYKDVPNTNVFGTFLPGAVDFVFTENEIKHQGQMIGVIVAKSQLAASTAAKKVKIEYDTEGFVPITNLKQAIKLGSFFPPTGSPDTIGRGDVEKTFADPNLTIIEGETEFGSQYAFYMEPQTAFAEPIDNKVLVVHASVQDPSNIQHVISIALGTSAHKVQVIAKRVGGGFGSKVSQAVRTAIAASVCATKLGAPVTIALDRNTDMLNIGKRHPFLCKYKASVDPKTGKIIGIKSEFYCDCGYGLDFSPMIAFIAMMDFDNCYFLENILLKHYLAKTNTPNNTAVRSFGGIQALYFIESVINEISLKLKIPLTKVHEANFYKPGQTTPVGVPILEPDFTLHQIWPEALKNSRYFEKEKEIEEYNRANRWRKRGISVVPLRYAAGGFAFMRHGCELNVYSDGSVVVGTSGVDMGQGLNTKVAQEVSHFLGIPIELITVNFTDTFGVPNGTMTAGSTGSISCMIAARGACDIIQERLAGFKKAKPEASWKELCQFAIHSGAHLSVSGYFVGGRLVKNSEPITPETAVNPHIPSPMDCNSCGVCVSEVEVDILTGEVQILSAYIYYDTGKSSNPAVDIGQMEGGFVMGLGNLLSEEVVVSPDGFQLSDSTWNYKIPSSLDIPIHSAMHLFSKVPNLRGPLRSKAASEGPMTLSVAIFFAIRNSLRSARADSGIEDKWFAFDPPATPHNICAHTGTTLAHLKAN